MASMLRILLALRFSSCMLQGCIVSDAGSMQSFRRYWDYQLLWGEEPSLSVRGFREIHVYHIEHTFVNDCNDMLSDTQRRSGGRGLRSSRAASSASGGTVGVIVIASYGASSCRNSKGDG